jgi:guanosine-3',5'-bis(diphosphate) 3'-pyrophosphohydrolase
MANDAPLPRLIDAFAFAAHKHRNQRRKDPDASPYINHPIALSRVLAIEGGVDDVDTLVAAVLHDTVEDTETTYEELCAHFGVAVADLVMEVTDDRSLPKAERKAAQIEHAPHLTPRAKRIKLADKICNLRDVAMNAPRGWPRQRQQDYFDWAKQVIDRLRGVDATLEALFDSVYKLRPPDAPSAATKRRSKM